MRKRRIPLKASTVATKLKLIGVTLQNIAQFFNEEDQAVIWSEVVPSSSSHSRYVKNMPEPKDKLQWFKDTYK